MRERLPQSKIPTSKQASCKVGEKENRREKVGLIIHLIVIAGSINVSDREST